MTGRSNGGGGMAWPSVPLAALLESLESGSRPKGGARITAKGIPSIGGEHLDSDGSLRLENLRYVPESHFAQMAQGAIQQWDILLVKDGATTGKVALVRPEFPYPRAAVNEHVFILRVDQKVACPAYVFYFLFSSQGQTEILRDHRGATIGGISRNFASLVRVPLPPLSEQRRIVEILDQADRLRRLRAEAAAKAGRILPALFIKMFGDPATNPMGWRRGHLGDAIRETQYGTSKPANRQGAGVLLVRMNNISSSGELDLTNVKYIDLNDSELERHRLDSGDLLFNRTNSVDLVGKTGLWANPSITAVAASYLIRVRVNRDLAFPEYIWALMNTPFMKTVLANKARRAVGMANINATEFRRLPAIFAPIQLQQVFAERLSKLGLLRGQRCRSAAVLDQLFRGLMDRAFSGSLTASWREAHMKELLQEMEQQAKVLKEVP